MKRSPIYGMTAVAAEKYLEHHGRTIRIVSVDGKPCVVTRDILLNRNDVSLVNGVIVEVKGPDEYRETCPCEFPEIGSCSPSCSCAIPAQSGGCERCCQYGNRNQRLAMARVLASYEPPAILIKIAKKQ